MIIKLSNSVKINQKSFVVPFCAFLNMVCGAKNIYFCASVHTQIGRNIFQPDRGRLQLLSICCSFVVRSLSDNSTDNIQINNVEKSDGT